MQRALAVDQKIVKSSFAEAVVVGFALNRGDSSLAILTHVCSYMH